MVANTIVIMSDEHNPKVLGCAGHRIISTPYLDRLAHQGTFFKSAYTASPICVPARAAFATGKYIHQIGFWDNADPYDGSVPSWHQVIREAGHRVVSIGKLHFNNAETDHGFSEEILPMHVVEGKGDLLGLVREADLPKRSGAKKMAAMAGPGESTYTLYDRQISATAQIWLRERAKNNDDEPWVLFISFVAPHFPLTAPPEHFYKYFEQKLDMPILYSKEERPQHPFLADYRASCCYDDYFENEDDVHRALSGYFGLVSFLDEQIGKILKTVDDLGMCSNTNIIYTSDHGDNLGARGLWGKSTMYDEIAGVPLVASGPDFPVNKIVNVPVSHVDFYPTILDLTGVPFTGDGGTYYGKSLCDIARGAIPTRPVISEYHAMGSRSGAYMIRVDEFKYVNYAQFQPQLFNIKYDPNEINDLSDDEAYTEIKEKCHTRLLSVLDPIEVDARAKRRQAQQIEANGGLEKILERGDLAFTPVPGIPAVFDK